MLALSAPSSLLKQSNKLENEVSSRLAVSVQPIIRQYRDSQNATWNRYIQTEISPEGILLLVVENPDAHSDNDTASQQVVFRKLFAVTETAAVQKTLEYYLSLKDITLRDSTYYQKLSENLLENHKPIWAVTKNSWDWQDEEAFSKWHRESVTTDFAKGSGVKYDCADFGVLVRWIYAHDHKLPIANSLFGSGKLFGQWNGTAAWDKLPTDPDWKKDQRFKAALQYLFQNIYTRTIVNDLYPVKLDKTYVTPGTIILNLYSPTAGHTQVVQKIGAECKGRDCIRVIYGNEPANDVAFEDVAWIENKKSDAGGILRWRWAVYKNGSWKLVNKEQMPGFSLEQYSHPQMSNQDFSQWVFTKIGLNSTTLSKAFEAIDNMYSNLNQRINLTIAGHFICYVQKCESDSAEYNDYSTPARDLRFHGAQDKFFVLLSQIPAEDLHWIDQYLEDLKHSNVLGSPYSYYDFVMNTDHIADRLNSDPTKSIFDRWGFKNLDANQKTYVLTLLWSYAFSINRQAAVAAGYQACFSNGQQVSSCDQKDHNIISKRTDSFDQSLKIVRTDLLKVIPKLPESVRKNLIELTRNFYLFKDPKCLSEDNQSGYCLAKHFLFDDNNWVNQMTSLPWDPWKKRWGLE